MNIQFVLNKLVEKKDLTRQEAQAFIDSCVKGEVLPTQVAAVLTALRVKGETPDEIVGLIKGMRKHMVQIQNSKGKSQNVIDVCGTGGDKSNSFNISTCVAFVAAAAEILVAKHGNRAASSKCGSADVLEALGVNISLKPQQAEEVLKKVGMVFLFAPLYHPAMKYIAPVRKELGIRTVFNFLGPFLNPAGVKRQIIGVPSIEIAKKLSEVAKKLSYEHLLIVSSEDHLDEISISAKTHVFEVKKNRVRKLVIDPKDYGIKKAKLEDILGGDAVTNARIIKDILGGKKGPKRDIVLLNSAAALYISGNIKTLKEGFRLAKDMIDQGGAKEVLERLINQTRNYA